MSLCVGDHRQRCRCAAKPCAGLAETRALVEFGTGAGRSAPDRWRQRRFLRVIAASALMTPFGVKIRDWRHRKNRTLHQQAEALGVTAAYLSALETGTRGRPIPSKTNDKCTRQQRRSGIFSQFSGTKY